MKVVKLMYLLLLLLAYSCLESPNMPTGILNGNLPTITVSVPKDISYNSATLSGNIESGNGYKIKSRGFIIGSTSDLKNGMIVPIDLESGETGIGAYSKTIGNLDPSKQYYYAAFTENEKGTGYSPVISFKTLSESPTIVTNPKVKSANDGKAIFSGTVISTGASPIKKCGICWSILTNVPTLNDNVKYYIPSITEGEFSIELVNMTGSEAYYFRAFAENDHGTSYGEIIEFNTPQIWEALKPFPGSKRNFAATFTIGSNFYITTGDGGAAMLKDSWVYVTSTEEWQTKSEFPGNVRKSASAFVIGNKGYVGLGIASGNTPYDDFYYYNPNSNEWSNIERSFTGRARDKATGLSFNGKGYIIGGRVSSGHLSWDALTDIWEYQVTGETGSWERMFSFPVAIADGLGFTYNNRAFVAFGTSLKKYYNQIWEYNPDSRTYIQIATAPTDFYLDSGVTGVTVVGDFAYFIDGMNYIWKFNLNTKTWQKKSRMPISQSVGQCMFSNDNDIYVGLNQNTNVFYKYRPLWDN